MSTAPPRLRRILVISPPPHLRRSVAFALEVDGFVVTSRADLASLNSARGYDVVVLDHKAAKGVRPESVLSLCRSASVVLLAGTPQPWLIGSVDCVVQMPILGDALCTAVREVIGTRGGPK